MNKMVRLITAMQRKLIQLYPITFLDLYEEELIDVFQESCDDAVNHSIGHLIQTGFIELRDMPVNIFREHWTILRRDKMKSQPSPNQSFSTMPLSAAVAYGLSFIVIYLVYCGIDLLVNAGNVVTQGNSIWNSLYIHPNALALGFGTIYLGSFFSKRKAIVSGVSVFLSYMVLYRIWLFIILSLKTTSPTIQGNPIVPYIFSTVVGILVGGMVGFTLLGRKRGGWFILAGIAGWNLAWLIYQSVSIFVIQHSPLSGNVEYLMVGSLWYFIYFTMGAPIYGTVIGLSLGITAAANGNPQPSTSLLPH